jgi:hypothetical protein
MRWDQSHRRHPRAESAICLDPPPGGLAELITLRDKLACVWKQLLAAPSQIASPLIFDPRPNNHADNKP